MSGDRCRRVGLRVLSNAASIANHLALAADIVPGASLDHLRDEIMRIAGRRDSTAGPARPLDACGAVVADTVGAAKTA